MRNFLQQALIDQTVAPCFGGGHLWRKAKLHGCDLCGWHDGFACDTCRRCVDSEQEHQLYAAIAAGPWLPEEDNDEDQDNT
jgi:hypothetical protein